ncbi:putative Zinc metalloproteinase nas-13 [Hypsibius exemplaris]|uniref:Metalloendopeptidase n=1 Tax=Hypsibius exemplaris TaxID=2072580 RepID=A0A1W0WXB7_HYPEX|nr:putative Zinc metalloproteinase nas-13 [Hypsibius exemplaris]
MRNVILFFLVAGTGVFQVLAAGGGSQIQPGDEIAEPDELEDYEDVYVTYPKASGKPSGTGGNDRDSSPPRRTIRLWPNGVVKYKISPSLQSDNPDKVAKLKALMNDLTKKTCVRFEVAKASDISYVSIIPGLKCSSMTGKQEGVSTLMLSVAKCFDNASLARGLMRNLGFTYESNRADRDQYITINWDNVAESNKAKFNKLSAEDYPVTDMPYDFGSVTHYPKNIWAKNKGTWTVKAKNPRDSSVRLGNTRGFSEGDIAKIKKLYKCR